MSYQTYITEALVCGNFDHNTADRNYLLFTKEAGMLYASARSVREEKSKQRYALQDFSLITVSLVKGKTGWRIGSVEACDNYFLLAESREARGSVVAIFKLLRRLVQGEEAVPEIFDFCREGFLLVSRDIANRAVVDTLFKLKLLSLLGYVDEQSLPNNFKHWSWHKLLAEQGNFSAVFNQVLIEKGIANSHL